MTLRFSLLKRLLAGQLTAAGFAAAVQAAPGAPIEEDADLVISPAELKVLCRLYYSRALGAEQLTAIAEALLSSQRVEFADDRSAELMEEMSGADAPFTAIRAITILGAV